MTERRRFIATAGGAMAAVAAAAIVDAPNVIAQPKVQWRMSTAWTSSLDTLQSSAQRLAKVVEETSGGRFRIEVFPGGQIMPPFDCFEATSQGKIESFTASSYYWTAKEPALEWFATVPFGMNPQGMAAWYYQGDGLKLWEEAYAPFNLLPRPGPGIRAHHRHDTGLLGDLVQHDGGLVLHRLRGDRAGRHVPGDLADGGRLGAARHLCQQRVRLGRLAVGDVG